MGQKDLRGKTTQWNSIYFLLPFYAGRGRAPSIACASRHGLTAPELPNQFSVNRLERDNKCPGKYFPLCRNLNWFEGNKFYSDFHQILWVFKTVSSYRCEKWRICSLLGTGEGREEVLTLTLTGGNTLCMHTHAVASSFLVIWQCIKPCCFP